MKSNDPNAYNKMTGQPTPAKLTRAISDPEGVREGKKPDFLDMDKDGNKKEPMKKAVADKKKNPFAKVKEDSDRAPAKKKEREATLPSGAKVKSTTVQGWQSQKGDKAANKERKDSYKAEAAGKCNHTPKGKSCPVHGLKECSSMYESDKFDPLKHVEKKMQTPPLKKAAKDVDRKSYGDRTALMKAGGVKDDRGPRGVTSGK
jgi:hypothetical protein